MTLIGVKSKYGSRSRNCAGMIIINYKSVYEYIHSLYKEY
jgi:hypothetical protein